MALRGDERSLLFNSHYTLINAYAIKTQRTTLVGFVCAGLGTSLTLRLLLCICKDKRREDVLVVDLPLLPVAASGGIAICADPRKPKPLDRKPISVGLVVL